MVTLPVTAMAVPQALLQKRQRRPMLGMRRVLPMVARPVKILPAFGMALSENFILLIYATLPATKFARFTE
jgi:hypothetical protein